MKRKHFTILMGGLTCLLGGILIAGNILAFKTYSSFLTTQFGMEGAGITNFNTNQYFLRELSSQEEAYQKLIDVSERTVEEGTILLKNEEVNGEKVLPLKTNSRVSLFSQSSIDFVHSSTVWGFQPWSLPCRRASLRGCAVPLCGWACRAGDRRACAALPHLLPYLCLCRTLPLACRCPVHGGACRTRPVVAAVHP